MIHLVGNKPKSKAGEHLTISASIWKWVGKGKKGVVGHNQARRLLASLGSDDRPVSATLRRFLQSTTGGFSVWDDNIDTPKVRYVHKHTVSK